jgi:hypothetical protein
MPGGRGHQRVVKHVHLRASDLKELILQIEASGE